MLFPGQSARHEIKHHKSHGFQVVSTRQLITLVCVFTCVSGRAHKRGLLQERNMLLLLVDVGLRKTEVHCKNGGALCSVPEQKVVWFDVPVQKAPLVQPTYQLQHLQENHARRF